MHTLVRVPKGVEVKQLSVEERLRLVEDELARIGRLLDARLVPQQENGARFSRYSYFVNSKAE